MPYDRIFDISLVIVIVLLFYISLRLRKRESADSEKAKPKVDPEHSMVQYISDSYKFLLKDCNAINEATKEIEEYTAIMVDTAKQIKQSTEECKQILGALPQQLDAQKAIFSKTLKQIEERLNRKPKTKRNGK